MTVKGHVEWATPAGKEWKECHGIIYINASVIEPEVDDYGYERNILDIFA